jgi:hypothetical protein
VIWRRNNSWRMADVERDELVGDVYVAEPAT